MKIDPLPQIFQKFPNVTPSKSFEDLGNELWLDWQWQYKNSKSIRTNLETPYYTSIPTDSSTAQFKNAEYLNFLSHEWTNTTQLIQEQPALVTNGSALDLRSIVANPMRVNESLVKQLQQAGIAQINFGFNHPNECTREAAIATWSLADAGFILNNQSTLLMGVNDQEATLQELNHRLLMMRVRPYCIFCYGPEMGLSPNLMSTVDRGVELIDSLRGWTSGLAVPFLVSKESSQKMTVHGPNYIKSQEMDEYIFRNYKNQEFPYHGS